MTNSDAGQSGSNRPELLEGSEPVFRLELFSQPRLLAAMRAMIHQLANRVGFPDAIASQIALAVDEALCNVIRHGYDQRTDERIWISVFILDETSDEPALRIVIDDLARQVDPNDIKPRDLSEVRPGGLGVHLIREIMDDVVYEQREPDGMRLTLTKRRTRDLSSAGSAKED